MRKSKECHLEIYLTSLCSSKCFALHPTQELGRQLELVSFPSHWFCNLCNPQIEVEAIYPFHSAFRSPPAYTLSGIRFS